VLNFINFNLRSMFLALVQSALVASALVASALAQALPESTLASVYNRQNAFAGVSAERPSLQLLPQGQIRVTVDDYSMIQMIDFDANGIALRTQTIRPSIRPFEHPYANRVGAAGTVIVGDTEVGCRARLFDNTQNLIYDKAFAAPGQVKRCRGLSLDDGRVLVTDSSNAVMRIAADGTSVVRVPLAIPTLYANEFSQLVRTDGAQLILTSSRPDPARPDADLLWVAAFSADTGEPIWQQEMPLSGRRGIVRLQAYGNEIAFIVSDILPSYQYGVRFLRLNRSGNIVTALSARVPVVKDPYDSELVADSNTMMALLTRDGRVIGVGAGASVIDHLATGGDHLVLGSNQDYWLSADSCVDIVQNCQARLERRRLDGVVLQTQDITNRFYTLGMIGKVESDGSVLTDRIVSVGSERFLNVLGFFVEDGGQLGLHSADASAEVVTKIFAEGYAPQAYLESSLQSGDDAYVRLGGYLVRFDGSARKQFEILGLSPIVPNPRGVWAAGADGLQFVSKLGDPGSSFVMPVGYTIAQSLLGAESSSSAWFQLAESTSTVNRNIIFVQLDESGQELARRTITVPSAASVRMLPGGDYLVFNGAQATRFDSAGAQLHTLNARANSIAETGEGDLLVRTSSYFARLNRLGVEQWRLDSATTPGNTGNWDKERTRGERLWVDLTMNSDAAIITRIDTNSGALVRERTLSWPNANFQAVGLAGILFPRTDANGELMLRAFKNQKSYVLRFNADAPSKLERLVNSSNDGYFSWSNSLGETNVVFYSYDDLRPLRITSATGTGFWNGFE